MGLFTPLAEGTSVFVGFETFDGQSWATLVVDYENGIDLFDGSADIVPGGSTFVDTFDQEVRVAVPFEWVKRADYRFTISREVVAGGE